MPAEPRCPDPESALIQALLCAHAQPETVRLYEAFGLYAVKGEGWWWRLQFVAEYDVQGQAAGDTFTDRVRLIVSRWRHEAVKYRDRPREEADAA